MESQNSGSGNYRRQASVQFPYHRLVSSSIKVLTITGIIILGIILGGGPMHDRIGFRYWKNPGPFVDYLGISGLKGQFLRVCTVTTQVAFSFIGTEVVAVRGLITPFMHPLTYDQMAAAEARNPCRNIPKAIKTIYFHVFVLYIGSVFIIGLLVPSNNPSLGSTSTQPSASPFVTVIKEASIKVVPSVRYGSKHPVLFQALTLVVDH